MFYSLRLVTLSAQWRADKDKSEDIIKFAVFPIRCDPSSKQKSSLALIASPLLFLIIQDSLIKHEDLFY